LADTRVWCIYLGGDYSTLEENLVTEIANSSHSYKSGVMFYQIDEQTYQIIAIQTSKQFCNHLNFDEFVRCMEIGKQKCDNVLAVTPYLIRASTGC